jgi:type IV secretion system protein VirB4
MLNLREYRRTSKLLADYLPWAALIAPGIVLNKDGSFQRTFRFRGPDLESATEAELVATCARLNNVFRRLGSGWALFIEAERFPAPGYPSSVFPDPLSALVDEERRALFEPEDGEEAEKRQNGRSHHESAYHLTLLYMPPEDRVSRAERVLLERSAHHQGLKARDYLAAFTAETNRIHDLFSGLMPEMRPLDDGETLTYLHGTISTRRHPVAVPETPMYLDAVLLDEPLLGGLDPMLGDRHLRTLSIKGFPNLTRPGLLDELNDLHFPYRWVTRFIPLDKTAASQVLTKLRRQWFAKRKSILAILREVMFNEPTSFIDSDADNKAADADAALQELGGDDVAFGYLTTTVTVFDATSIGADERLRAVERVINSRGFTTIRETVNAVEAWLGSLPGHVYANVRQPLVHTLNLAHLMPLSAVWAGPESNEQLGGPPLLLAATQGSTPFRLSTHVGDVGHMFVVGPTGAGKSVLLALMALQFRRYEGAQVYIFDKGFSARAAVLGMDGDHFALGAAGSLAFQPLLRIDDPAVRSWAADWIQALFQHERVALTPEIKETLWSALTNLSSAPPAERTLTGLSVLLQSNPLKAALAPYTLEGPFGRLLDASEDHLAIGRVQCFEMEELMHQQAAVAPVLTYLFHRLEERFDGEPTLLLIDEAWLFLDDPLFAGRMREWLKTLRKKNVAVVFATQSLADIADSKIAPVLIESCPQRIFLPNDRALEPQARAAYERFGLNDRQINLIAASIPKRDYYLQSRRGNRLFDLGLGPIALAVCATSSAADQARIGRAIEEFGTERFAEVWLRTKGLKWAAKLMRDRAASTLQPREDQT